MDNGEPLSESDDDLSLHELDRLGTLSVIGGGDANNSTIAYSNIYARLVQDRDTHEYAFLDYAQLTPAGKEAVSALLELYERMISNPLLSSRAYLEMLDDEENRLNRMTNPEIREKATQDLNTERLAVYEMINYVRRSGRTLVDFSDVKEALMDKELRIGKWINRMPWPYQRAYRIAQVDKADSERWWDFLQKILAPAMSLGRRRGGGRGADDQGRWNPAEGDENQ